MRIICFSLLFILSILVSCVDKNGTDSTELDTSLKSNQTVVVKPEQNILVYTKYNLPLPVELFKFIKNEQFDFNKSLMNPVENRAKYNTSIIKAVNFGIYASDLAYCTVFEQNQESILYFNTTKELADELHIAEGYNKEIVERMHNNIDNPDSLHEIATKAYWNACNYLEANNEVNILPFVVTAGWLESMHLAIHSANQTKPETKILEEIGRQKIALDNLIEYLLDVMMDSNTFEVNKDVQELGKQLVDIKEVYNQIEKLDEITQEQFWKIGVEVDKARAHYVK